MGIHKSGTPKIKEIRGNRAYTLFHETNAMVSMVTEKPYLFYSSVNFEPSPTTLRIHGKMKPRLL